MEGLSKLKMAVPLPPVLALVSLTSGTHGSSTPLMNCIRAASHTTALRCSRSGAATRLAVKGLAPAGGGSVGSGGGCGRRARWRGALAWRCGRGWGTRVHQLAVAAERQLRRSGSAAPASPRPCGVAAGDSAALRTCSHVGLDALHRGEARVGSWLLGGASDQARTTRRSSREAVGRGRRCALLPKRPAPGTLPR
jgi:hypothetical protein